MSSIDLLNSWSSLAKIRANSHLLCLYLPIDFFFFLFFTFLSHVLKVADSSVLVGDNQLDTL